MKRKLIIEIEYDPQGQEEQLDDRLETIVPYLMSVGLLTEATEATIKQHNWHIVKVPSNFQVISYKEWVLEYRPYSTNGEPIKTSHPVTHKLLRDIDPKYLWTLCHEDGQTFIDAGIHIANSLGFYTCQNPWPHSNIQVQFPEGE